MPSFTSRQLPNKYSGELNARNKQFIPDNINSDCADLLRASLSQSSWCKNATALKCFKCFESQSPNCHPWPLSEKSVCEFVTWAVKTRDLKAATVKSYLGAISLAHKFMSIDYSNCMGFWPSMLLKGAENLEFYKNISRESRKAMTLPVLKILGHQLATSDLPADSQMVIWTACVIAFFGSFRLGEILPANEKRFNPSDTLLWNDVKVRGDSVLIHIKIPKGRNPQGEFVDLFEFDRYNCCPVKALKALSLAKNSKVSQKTPVFQFKNGTLLSAKALTEKMQMLLEPKLGQAAKLFTGHSFRAAIPSALSNNPELASDEEIKLWGRWGSPSYKCYTKLVMKRRKAIFVKLTSALM